MEILKEENVRDYSKTERIPKYYLKKAMVKKLVGLMLIISLKGYILLAEEIPTIEFIKASLKNQENLSFPALRVKWEVRILHDEKQGNSKIISNYVRTPKYFFLENKHFHNEEEKYIQRIKYDRSSGIRKEIGILLPDRKKSAEIDLGLGPILGGMKLETTYFPIFSGNYSTLYEALNKATITGVIKTINGYKCFLLKIESERNYFNIWLGQYIGFCPVLIEEFSDANLINKIQFLNYKEIVKGFWFPMKMITESFTPKGLIKNEWQVIEISAGKPVSEEEIKIEFPPGTEVIDHTTGRIFTVSEKSVYPFTEKEFYEFLKKKRQLVNSGKIIMREYNIEWKNENDYKEFVKELKNYRDASPEKFKEWFYKKEKSLLRRPEQFSSYRKLTYYFRGIEKFPYEKEHLIEEYSSLEEVKKYIEDVKKKHKDIVVRIPKKVEYLWDGRFYKEYEIYFEEYGVANELRIFPAKEERDIHFKLHEIDFSFAFHEYLPVKAKEYKFGYKFIHEGDKVILESYGEKGSGKTIFDCSRSGVSLEKIALDKNRNLIEERIYGAYSLVDNIIHLPYFSSIARFSPSGIWHTLYVIENYELNSVKEEDFSIKILPNTEIIDYSSGKEPQSYFYKEK